MPKVCINKLELAHFNKRSGKLAATVYFDASTGQDVFTVNPFYVMVENADGISDHPIRYASHFIAYDHPERYNKSEKLAVKRAFDFIDRMRLALMDVHVSAAPSMLICGITPDLVNMIRHEVKAVHETRYYSPEESEYAIFSTIFAWKGITVSPPSKYGAQRAAWTEKHGLKALTDALIVSDNAGHLFWDSNYQTQSLIEWMLRGHTDYRNSYGFTLNGIY